MEFIVAEKQKEKDRVTLVHLSDLHIGEVFLTEQFSLVAGWRSHDSVLCFGLENALNDARAFLALDESEPLWLAMTGDLTRFGLPNEYCVGHTFLSSRFRLSHGDECGLAVSKSHLKMIPGNHDHWNGQPGIMDFFIPSGFNPDTGETHFPSRQWPTRIVSTRGGFRLIIAGIDSNSGFRAREGNLLAKGRITDEALSDLRKAFAQAEGPPPLVRCLLCHHSLCFSGEPSGFLGRGVLGGIRPLVMEQSSKERLLGIARDVPIHVFLTGHTHTFESKGLIDDECPPFELRCSTTLQGPATEAHQGFWVHEVSLTGDAIKWDSHRFQWDGGRFNRLRSSWHSFLLPTGS
jgi:3',5'-cyclic AMP phosphodiesterase CpdA